MKQKPLLILPSFMIIPLLLIPAYGQTIITDPSCPTCVNIPDLYTLDLYKEQLPLVIWIEPTIYDHNSIIEVKGHSNRGETLPVTITVSSPIRNVVSINQATPDSNGDFSVSLNTAGKLWKQDGEYIISAQLGNEGGGIKTFRVQALVLPNVGADSPINYEIEGGQVISVVPDVKTTSLIISLTNTTTEGLLKVYLPRTVIDAKLPQEVSQGIAGGNIPQRHKVQHDDEFVLMVDGKTLTKLNENSAEVEFTNTVPLGTYKEETILDTRILTIPFSEGAKKVEIAGTFVIPEFGILVYFVLISAILGIIIVTRRQSSLFNILR